MFLHSSFCIASLQCRLFHKPPIDPHFSHDLLVLPSKYFALYFSCYLPDKQKTNIKPHIFLDFTIHPRHPLKKLFFRLCHASLISFTWFKRSDHMMTTISWHGTDSQSLQHSSCKFLKSSKSKVELFSVIDLGLHC